ncbi:MAG TPA: hypothetical protein VME69_06730 [Methylocella sp.]|nr:hypothetical protein [Methylocella sp.]
MKWPKFLLILCWSAATGLGFSQSGLAGELQSGNGLGADGRGRCARPAPDLGQRTDRNLCEEINGHIRVDLDSPYPNPPGYGRPGASPVAVRIEDDNTARNHLRLPSSDWGYDPYRR